MGAIRHRVGIVGLGVVGRRFFDLMRAHPRFAVTAICDLDPARTAAASADQPDVALAASVEQLAARADVDVVYVATPPAAHRRAVEVLLAHGKHVFCEKPLSVSDADAEAMILAAGRSGRATAVNFVHGSSLAADGLADALADGRLGRVVRMDVRLHFARWPRAWQAAAGGWLAGRKDGGFLREVGSHWAYLAGRLFGFDFVPGVHAVHYPDDAEGAEISAMLEFVAGGIPVTMAGTVGGRGPDLVECFVRGEARSARIRDWYRLDWSDGGEWQCDDSDFMALAAGSYRRQLDRLAGQLDGDARRLPDFAEAYAVQKLIERVLA